MPQAWYVSIMMPKTVPYIYMNHYLYDNGLKDRGWFVANYIIYMEMFIMYIKMQWCIMTFIKYSIWSS